MRTLTALVVVLSLFALSTAQEKPKGPGGGLVGGAKGRADPKDVGSIDGIVKALYAVISGGKGEERDWSRFRSLFHPDARMLPIVERNDGIARAAIMKPAEYIDRAGDRLKDIGFTETEVARKVEHFRHVAHVWSIYEARIADKPDEVYMSGINSIQLLWDNERWWILHIAWSPADENNPIPARYRKAK